MRSLRTPDRIPSTSLLSIGLTDGVWPPADMIRGPWMQKIGRKTFQVSVGHGIPSKVLIPQDRMIKNAIFVGKKCN